ncbi:MAG TPA: DUF4412 domain-containing protein [Puia sp.]|uniref:DUF4412 domain-containing protein n=1 Tax=Puia sp. TaxID=2045100 RepID=UPI002D113CBD|nr:DUF4412 domain-containing protein [Puia sp.]HVU94808.1 DUF4412 domain-containing protein [Puia sp.]
MAGIPAANAQGGFLKKVINSAKNSAQNRANNAASNATNKALDKVDPTTKGGTPSTPNSGDKSDNDRVLGGFAKAAQDNPNDSNLIAKALGNIMSGNGVSAEDSAKALAAFKNTGNSGNTPCIYYEITNTVIPDKKGQKTSSSITKQWFTKDGRYRGEMDLAGMIASAAGYQIDSKPIVMIGRVEMPNYTVTLDDESKTYSLNIIDQALLDKGGSGYTAKLIGSETVNGYPCKHVVIKGHKMTLDMWTSTSVPGYDVYQKLASTAAGANASFLNALKQVGADGIMVKTIIENNASSMTLTKAIYIGADNSLFEIPAGYTKTEYNGVITNLMKAGMGGKK